VLTLAINNVAQKDEAALKCCEDGVGARRHNPQASVCEVWCLRF
jgi:hypothetical protein